MFVRLKVYLVVIAVLQCICLCFILMGITGGFDGTSNHNHVSEDDDEREIEHKQNSNSTIDSDTQIPDKVVLMLIDALRLDFLTEENFPFLMGKLRNYRRTTMLKFDVKVDSPTVTLPRVKTLVTGKSPVYMDVLRNLQTADTVKKKGGINQPNLISSLRKGLPELNICFFGDETWLRLFPAESENFSPYFKKWEGVTSFYVRDFYEVDKNITRHLEDIDDCNFLILHYLGLDHIGHVHGPKPTELLRRKLNEMDHVIQHLHSHLSHVKTKHSKNLLMITGDHGMANVGGHGGSSFEEVVTPLVGLIIGGSPYHHSQIETAQINQIDIAPTLASLWNIVIPQESRGQLILDVIEPFKSSDQLANSYQRNCKHLLRLLGNSRKAATYKLWWSEISKMEKPLAIKKYIELEHELSSALRNSSSNRKSDLLSSFVISMVLLICMELYLFTCLRKVLGKHARFAVAAVFLPPVFTYFSSSFIEEEHYIRYYLYPTLLMIFVWSSPRNKLENFLIMLKLLTLHRLSMSLNQTGDKWSHLPDLNDAIQDRNLGWITATIAVILVYTNSKKTVKCSTSFIIALMAVYLTKLVVHYVDEEFRANWHWILLDGKLQKLTFLIIFFHLIHNAYLGNTHMAATSSGILFLLMLQRFQNLIVVGLVFTQANLLNRLMQSATEEVQRHEKKSSLRISSLLSRLLVLWFAHSSFFYQGNSNGLATVDVNAGYIGIESYSSNVLIGFLIFANTFSGPLITYMSISKSESPSRVIMNGSAHVPNQAVSKQKAKSKDREVTKKLSEYLPVLLLLSSGAQHIIYSCTIMIFQNHLFIWSVFVPKLLYLICESVVYVLIMSFYAFIF